MVRRIIMSQAQQLGTLGSQARAEGDLKGATVLASAASEADPSNIHTMVLNKAVAKRRQEKLDQTGTTAARRPKQYSSREP